MKRAIVVFIGLLAILLPAQAQIMGTPTEEVEAALKGFVDGVGLIIPAEDAFLNFIAVFIVYSVAIIRYIAGHTVMLALGPYIGLCIIYIYGFVKVLMEMVYVASSATERACAWVPCVGSIPALCNGCIALTNFFLEPLFLGVGHLCIDLSNTLLPLTEYCPPPF